MKKILSVFVMLLTLAACGNKQAGKSVEASGEDSVRVDSIETETTYFPAIGRYLVDSIGSSYAKGEICVPMPSVVAVDERKSDDILVWGDFWVMNYNMVGDTLKTVSGGSHPGLMHIRQTENGFEVIGFDQVGDGSLFLKTAKQIFGDKFEAFQSVQSDAEKRKKHQEALLSTYIKKHGIAATMYQDSGRDAVALP